MKPPNKNSKYCTFKKTSELITQLTQANVKETERERDFDIFFNCFETIGTFPYRCVKTLVHTAHSMCEILSLLNQGQYQLSPGQSLQLPSATAARILPIKESLGEKKKKKMEIHNTIHIILVSSIMKFSN